MLPGKGLEFESKEYEDVMNKENEVEDLSHSSESFIYLFILTF